MRTATVPTGWRFRRTGGGFRRTPPAGSPSGRRGRRPANPVKRTTETDAMTTNPSELNTLPVDDVWPQKATNLYVTVSTGQPWDGLHRGAYDAGGIVLELNDNEEPVRAYREADERD